MLVDDVTALNGSEVDAGMTIWDITGDSRTEVVNLTVDDSENQ